MLDPSSPSAIGTQGHAQSHQHPPPPGAAVGGNPEALRALARGAGLLPRTAFPAHLVSILQMLLHILLS